MKDTLFTLLDNHYSEMVSIRRHLHKYPEVSFQEYKTAAFIEQYYNQLDIPVRTKVGGGGIVAVIEGGLPGKTVALRADFDALPIQDEKDVPYQSTIPGVMHACGHDGHTALLLVLAKSLKMIQSQLTGTYVFIHQHAEEYAPGGAKPMIEDGCLDGVDFILGTHLWAPLPTGTLCYRSGAIMAAADRFEIMIKGKGGHGAEPHGARDPIVIGAQIVSMLQTIVSRRTSPLESCVVTIGQFHAGNAFNIIPDTANMEGTVRTFNEEIRNKIAVEIEQIVAGVCMAAGCAFEYRYIRGYPPVVNHPEETARLVASARNVPELIFIRETDPLMVGEDFSYYLQHTKGTFFLIGAAPEGVTNPHPHHHPLFDINEKSMLIGAKTLVSAALHFVKDDITLQSS